MDEQQREDIAIAWRKAFASMLKASASYREPAPDSFGRHMLDLLVMSAAAGELDARTEAEEQRRLLRTEFGPLACLTPDWWTVRRFERRSGQQPPHRNLGQPEDQPCA